MDATPKLLRISAFCAIYGVGKTIAYELIKTGALEAVKINSDRRIVTASAEKWAASLPRVSPQRAA